MKLQFDPVKHIAFETAPTVISMIDLGYPKDNGISAMAVSKAFPLFTSEAICMMRAELFQPEVQKTCKFSSNIAAAQLRGWAKRYAPFTYAAWTHPATTAIVSKIAGANLVPWGDYEIAHTNLSVDSNKMKTKRKLRDGRMVKTERAVEETLADRAIVGWHRDSYPFVCVLMLSDCTGMVGGETALRAANGKVLRIRGPTEGCAVVLAGRYITHQALAAHGAAERITAVTSYRPQSAFMRDDSVLRTVRPVSELSELYHDFASYRLDILEQRIRRARHDIKACHDAEKAFNTHDHKAFLQETIAFLEHTNREIVEEKKVPKGYLQIDDDADVRIEKSLGEDKSTHESLNGERIR